MSVFRWKFWLKNKERQLLAQLDPNRMPKHIAVIMDGNGRWAQRKGLPRIAGHRAGLGALRATVNTGNEIGLKRITFFAFSTENWKRPRNEVEFLMRLPQEYLEKELPNLIVNNIRLNMIGKKEGLPALTLSAVEEGIKKTKENTGMEIVFALNYGGRADIVNAVRCLAEKIKKGSMSPEEITEETFSDFLDTKNMPDPDLLIRPSGELRLSNFLLYQIAYSELWFSNIYWPDFDRKKLLEAIIDYQQRDRRFGGIKL